MAYKEKISLSQLSQALRDGKTITEIAKEFSMTPGAICQRKKLLKRQEIQTVVLEKVNEIIEGHLDLRAQLSRINAAILQELDRAQDAIEKAETQVDQRLWQEIMVKLCSEVRKQLSCQLEIFSAWNDWKVYAEFQADVIEIIGSVSNEAKKEIVARLQQRRLLRGATRID